MNAPRERRAAAVAWPALPAGDAAPRGRAAGGRDANPAANPAARPIMAPPPAALTGATLVEFALLLTLLLAVLFSVMEAARAMYLWNTLQEVTRRAAAAAAVADFSDGVAADLLRRRAVFRDTAGALALGAPVTDAHVRIDYLSLARNGDGSMTLTPIADGLLPACPARNRLNCAANPNGAACIRFVRARICAPGAGCAPVAYQPLFPLVALPATLPVSTTIARAESLGYAPGSPLCP